MPCPTAADASAQRTGRWESELGAEAFLIYIDQFRRRVIGRAA